MLKLIASGLGKFLIGISLITFGQFMGLPTNDPWFDVLILYLFGRWVFLSIVNGMPEPNDASSDWYIWSYRTMHSMAHVATAYFTHKSLWKLMTREGDEPAIR